MNIAVEIEFRDDTKKTYTCWDAPYIADWVILYLDDGMRTRLVLPKEAIKTITYSYGITP